MLMIPVNELFLLTSKIYKMSENHRKSKIIFYDKVLRISQALLDIYAT